MGTWFSRFKLYLALLALALLVPFQNCGRVFRSYNSGEAYEGIQLPDQGFPGPPASGEIGSGGSSSGAARADLASVTSVCYPTGSPSLISSVEIGLFADGSDGLRITSETSKGAVISVVAWPQRAATLSLMVNFDQIQIVQMTATNPATSSAVLNFVVTNTSSGENSSEILNCSPHP